MCSRCLKGRLPSNPDQGAVSHADRASADQRTRTKPRACPRFRDRADSRADIVAYVIRIEWFNRQFLELEGKKSCEKTHRLRIPVQDVVRRHVEQVSGAC